MNSFSLLKKTSKVFLELYLNKDIILNNDYDAIHDLLEENFISFTLDIFPRVLDQDDEEIKQLDSLYFLLSQHDKYINFLKEAFAINNNICGLSTHCFKKTDDYAYNLNILNSFDTLESFCFFHQILEHYPSKHTNFIIDDLALLNTFSRGIIGNFIRGELYFEKYHMLLCSNFDLSLPVFFKKEKDMLMYRKIAEKHGLFFR